MTDDGIRPVNRLWTPWRMAYVGGEQKSSDCVFCAAAAGEDDVTSLVLHRGEYSFVILNLFPYNTGHLMVVPYEHVNDLAMLAPEARTELVELTASFTAGLRFVMGCEGLNLGMNLGSAAGAGIADHLHQHLVPRWIGDANFMPLVGGTKVLPELLPATYGKLRSEIVRQKSGADRTTVVLVNPNGRSIYLDRGRLARVPLTNEEPVWRSVVRTLRPVAASLSLLGWAGSASTRQDDGSTPVLAVQIMPSPESHFTEVPVPPVSSQLVSIDDRAAVDAALTRFT